MEAKDTREATGQRTAFLIALGALSISAAAAFGRVFAGSSISLRLAIAALVSTGIAVLLERRSILLSAVATLGSLALATGVIVFKDTLWFGLPTAETLRAAGEAARAVGHEAAVQVAPALPLAPLVLAALVAVWLSAFASHTLAVRAGSPFLAILPPAALMGFAGVVVEDGVRPLYVLGFLAATLALTFADAVRRVGRWGPVTAWRSGAGGARFGSLSATRSARGVAAACLGIAAFAPWVLPGFGASGLVDLEGNDQIARVSINPIVDLRPSLLQNPVIPLFSVRTDRAAYWRFLTLDRFNGRLWTATDPDAASGEPVGTGDGLPPAPDLATDARLLPVRQSFVFDALAQPWLPAASNPVAISAGDSPLRFEANSGVLVAPNGTYPGFAYDVLSEAVAPRPADLDSIEGFEEASGFHRYTVLPPGMPPQIATLARNLTAAQPTPYRKILAIQEHLRSFTYDERAPVGHGTSDILFFLQESRRGYCEQFAGAMAVLLRSLDIPARVAIGFTPGTRDAEEPVWRVDTKNAHAWVEVLFPGYGWLPFEPTPTRENPVASTYTSSPPVLFCLRVGCADGELTPPLGEPGAVPTGPNGFERRISGPDEAARERLLRAAAAAREAGEAPPADPRRLIPVGIGALLLLAGLAIPLAKSARNRMALARANGPTERVVAAYGVLGRRASDLGLGRRPQETPVEYARRLRDLVDLSDGDLDRLTALVTRAAYSLRDVSDQHAEAARKSARRVAIELGRATPLWRRVLGWFWVDRLAWAR